MHIESWVVSRVKEGMIPWEGVLDLHEKSKVGPFKNHRPFVELFSH
jgi:hypothetical protein